ncbi:hypothetical protein Scep_009209 [Stephania cephalantha]|uniref:protein-serine/threonine phosphatase n=1 Tax=Stephania cephalantha TaxID=152367 RepID=A0AAP0JSQ6_9MAGN
MGCCRRWFHKRSSSDDDSPERQRIVSPRRSSRHLLTGTPLQTIHVPSHNLNLEYSAFTHRGYYPYSLDHENQDSFCIKTRIQGNPNLHFFGVFDGHGRFGDQCSHFVRDRLIEILSSDQALLDDPVKAYNTAFLATNSELHDSNINDAMSGTTAITVLVIGDTLFVANVGDSRAVIAAKHGNRIVAESITNDQTPYREDEYERVKLCGARVLTFGQIDGEEDPNVKVWSVEEDDEDPPRIWLQDKHYPGAAFSRSLGDSVAETIGVIGVPEVSVVKLIPHHMFFVIASDGVFQYLTSQVVVNMVARYRDPRDACAAVAGESYKKWLEKYGQTDDITIIVVYIKHLNNT